MLLPANGVLLMERHPRLPQIKEDSNYFPSFSLALAFFIYLDDERMLRSLLTGRFSAALLFLGWNTFEIFCIGVIDSGLGV